MFAMKSKVTTNATTKYREKEDNESIREQENEIESSKLKSHPLQHQQQSWPWQRRSNSPVHTACDRRKCTICGKLPLRYHGQLVQTIIWDGAGGPGATGELLTQHGRDLQRQQEAIRNLMELGLLDIAPKIVWDRNPKVEQAVACRICSMAGRQVRLIDRELKRSGLLEHNQQASPIGNSSNGGSTSRPGSTISQTLFRHAGKGAEGAAVKTAGRHQPRHSNPATKCGLSSCSGEIEMLSKSQRWTRPGIVAPFMKTEVATEGCLGSGGFCSVFEVASFQPKEEELEVSAAQQAARIFLTENARRQVDIPVGKSRKLKPWSGMNSYQATEARYAMKHLKYGLAEDLQGSRFEEAATDLVREGLVLAGLDHPNIIRIHGCSCDGAETYRTGFYTNYFLILDKVTETLESRIWFWRQSYKKYKSRSAWPGVRNKFLYKMQRLWIERIRAALDLGQALAYMHKHGLMHRDIKSSNVGFDVHGDLRVFDFGLSQFIPRDVNTEVFDPASKTVHKMSRVGTKYYMAPEVRSRNLYNVSADVYSYGVVLWEILTMSNPRDAIKKFNIRKEDCDHGGRWLPLCPCWPQEIRQLLRDCLRSDPHHRPTMKEAVDVLTKHLTEQELRQHVDLDNYGSSGITQTAAEDRVNDSVVTIADDSVALSQSTVRLDLSGIDFTELSRTTSICSSGKG